MQNRPATFPIFVVVVSALFCAELGIASEARYSGLGDNPMVDDLVDIVDFPGMVAAYGNTAFLDVTQTAPYGNAGFLIGDRIVGGAWVNRVPMFDDFEKTDELFSSFTLPDAYNIADLFLGTRSGFGIRLSVLAGLDTDDSETDPNSDEVYSNGESLFGLELAPGFSFDAGKYHGDFGLGVTFSQFEVAIDGNSAYKSKWAPSSLLRHRSIIAPLSRTSWIVDLGITTRVYSAKAQGENSADGLYTHLVGSLVVGPRARLPFGITLWGGLHTVIEHLSGEVASIPQEKLTGLGLPGLVLSGEVAFLKYFAFRAGIFYDVYWTIASSPDGLDQDGDGDQEEIVAKSRDMGQRFRWSTGLGAAIGGFQIDGTISQDLYFDGPNVIGGNAPGFLGMLSATYTW